MFKRFGLGFAAGYLVGARNGEKHYERLGELVDRIRQHPVIKQLSEEGIDGLRDRARDAADWFRSTFQPTEQSDGEDESDSIEEDTGDDEDEEEPEARYDEEDEPEDEYREDDEAQEEEEERPAERSQKGKDKGKSKGKGRNRERQTHQSDGEGRKPRTGHASKAGARRSQHRSVSSVASAILERGRVA